MFYIHQSSCISAQRAFMDPTETALTESVDNKLYALNMSYDMIPQNVLRRLGKALKMGVATGIEAISKQPVDGIIIGTANGGLEDSIKFLNQLVEFNEGRLTPTNFVQSTSNAIAGQIAIMTGNTGYNITHVHQGLSFENALIDLEMLLLENPSNSYLVGGVDELSENNYNIEYMAGCYKPEDISNKELLESSSSGTIAGEGAAMFIANNNKENAQALIRGIKTIHSTDVLTVKKTTQDFLKEHVLPAESIDLVLIGKNGDCRLDDFYESFLSNLPESISIGYYKHLTGEFPTATAIALWIATNLFSSNRLHDLLKIPKSLVPKNILLYNAYKGEQHSLIFISKA